VIWIWARFWRGLAGEVDIYHGDCGERRGLNDDGNAETGGEFPYGFDSGIGVCGIGACGIERGEDITNWSRRVQVWGRGRVHFLKLCDGRRV
jgi:hypothetical protein